MSATLVLALLICATPDTPPHMPARVLRALELDPDGYNPARNRVVGDLLLGDLLYHSPRTLGLVAEREGFSCQRCHPNGAVDRTLSIEGLSDRPGNVNLTSGHFRAETDDGRANPINIPSLRGLRYTAPYGRDGRVSSLSEMTARVISKEFGGTPLSTEKLAALVEYLENLDFAPNRKLGPDGALVPAGVSARALAGERLFFEARSAQGEHCADCHRPDQYFRDGKVHRHKSGEKASPFGFDDGFETPTLLNTVESTPYFHDGRFADLAAVVGWYDETFRFGLGAEGRAALTAYLEAVGAVDEPEDRRTLAGVQVQTWAYLLLLSDGAWRADRSVWLAALEMVRKELTVRPPPQRISARVGGLVQQIDRLRAAVDRGAELGALEAEIRTLHKTLVRLSGDWVSAESPR